MANHGHCQLAWHRKGFIPVQFKSRSACTEGDRPQTLVISAFIGPTLFRSRGGGDGHAGTSHQSGRVVIASTRSLPASDRRTHHYWAVLPEGQTIKHSTAIPMVGQCHCTQPGRVDALVTFNLIESHSSRVHVSKRKYFLQSCCCCCWDNSFELSCLNIKLASKHRIDGLPIQIPGPIHRSRINHDCSRSSCRLGPH